MLYHPRLRRHLDAHVEAPNLVIVHGDGTTVRFHNRLLPLLVPHLDGENTPEDLVDILTREAAKTADNSLPDSTISLLDIVYGLQLLAEKNCLSDLDPETEEDDHLTAAHDALGLDAEARQRLRSTPVRVQALGDLDTGRLVEALTSSGIQVEDTAEIRIVVTDDYLSPDLDALNRAALDRDAQDGGTPWMLLRPTGTTPWIGPIFRPGSTGCWSCLAHRLRLNQPYADLLGTPPTPTLPTAQHLALQTAALRLLHWLTADDRADLEGRLWTLDVRTLETQAHVLARLPDCAACGAPVDAPASARPIRLSPIPLVDQSTASFDGGFRALPADVTFERLRQHVSPLTGLVHNVRPGATSPPDADYGLHVYLAEHAFPSPRREQALRTGQRARAAGKGMTVAQARTGAVCEALERYSGVVRGDEPRRHGRLRDFEDGEAIHPRHVLHFSNAQYAERDARNAAAAPGLAQQALWIPAPFDVEAEVDWTPLWSLTDQRQRYLPTACCYFHAPPSLAAPDLPRFAAADSNGCAAGTCFEEAILQGFLELVERDAVALWWYNRARRPGLDLSTVGDGAGAGGRLGQLIDGARDLHARLRRNLHVLDVTSDFGFPTYAAISRSAGEPQDSDPVFGFGCHLDAGIALARALTELGQSLPGLLAASAAPAAWAAPRRVLSGPLEATTFLDPEGSVPLRPAAPARAPERLASLKAAVEMCVDRARQLGLETLVLDQTRPEIGLVVVRVVVPGLRHFRPRWAPGRLFEVPVALGWLPAARREVELNPVYLLT